MKWLTISALLAVSIPASAENLAVVWEAPTHRVDGSQIESLDGYTLYYSIDNAPQAPISLDPSVSEYVFTDLGPGTYEAYLTAREGTFISGPSASVTYSILPKIDMTSINIRFECEVNGNRVACSVAVE